MLRDFTQQVGQSISRGLSTFTERAQSTPEEERKTKSFTIANENKIKNNNLTEEQKNTGVFQPTKHSWFTDFLKTKITEPLKKEDVREFRPAFSANSTQLNLRAVDRFGFETANRIAEAVPKFLTTVYSETAAHIESAIEAETFQEYMDILSTKNDVNVPFDARRLGFKTENVSTFAGDFNDLMDSGWGVPEAILYTAGNKFLDIGVGASILNGLAGAGLEISKSKPEAINRVEAWKTFGGPKNAKEITARYRQYAHQYHPDKALGSENLFKYATSQKDLLITKSGQATLPTKSDFIRYNSARVLDPLSQRTVIANITKSVPKIVDPKTGKTIVEMKANSWKNIWEDASTFPQRLAKPNLVKAGFQPHELPILDAKLALPGYRPIESNTPNLGLQIEAWEKVGGVKTDIAKSLTKTFGKTRANEIIRQQGEELVSSAASIGVNAATSKFMVGDVPEIKREVSNQTYESISKAVESQQLEPVFPSGKLSNSVAELSPSLFKLRNDSTLRKLQLELQSIDKSKELLPDQKEIGRVEINEKMLKEARELGIPIIKNSAGEPTLAIRNSGFYATDNMMKWEIGNFGGITTSPANASRMQDMTFQRQEGSFGPMTREVEYPMTQSLAAKVKAVDESIIGLQEVASKNNIKLNPENRTALTNLWETVPKNVLINAKPEYIKSHYGLDDSVELINVAQHTSKQMHEVWKLDNQIRKLMGRDEIKELDYFGPHMHRTSVMNKMAQEGAYEHGDVADFIIPNEVKNPHAKTRLNKISEEDLERDGVLLFERYMTSMYNDVFISPTIENIKAHNMVLEHLGKNKAKEYWENQIKTLTKIPTAIDKSLGIVSGTKRKAILEKIIQARIIGRLVFNPLFNVTTQPLSYLTLTAKETGLLNTYAKAPLKWMFDKEAKKEAANEVTMVLKSQKGGTAMYEGGMDSYGEAAHKGVIRRATDVMGILSNVVERNLTGMSYIAAKDALKASGFEGEELIMGANWIAGRTQQMYNSELRPPILNSTAARAGFPHETFSIEAFSSIKEIFGKGGMPADAKTRFTHALNWIAGIYLGAQYVRAIRGYHNTSPGDYVPYVGGGVDRAFDDILGTDFSFGKKDTVGLMDDLGEAARALGEIRKAIPEITNNDHETMIDLAREVVNYAVDSGNYKPLRDQVIFWGSGLVGLGGGNQWIKMIDFVEDAQRGYAENEQGQEWYPVELRDIPFGILFGSQITPSARQYEEDDQRILDRIEKQSKDRQDAQMEADKEYRRLNRIKEDSGKEMANLAFMELVEYDPPLAERVQNIIDEEAKNITVREARFLRLNVNNGERARELHEYYLETPIKERAKIFNEYIEKGIITQMVERQIKHLEEKDGIIYPK